MKHALKKETTYMSGTDEETRGGWEGWQPVWAAGKRNKMKPPKAASLKTTHDQQESHSPTEAFSLKLSAERQSERGRRRVVDARLWDAMSPAQQDAAAEIAIACETMGRGIGYVISDWQRLPGAGGHGNVSEAHARLIGVYIDWAQRCHRQKISHALVVDILVFGFSCKMLDRDRRTRAGTARDNLMRGLSLYCEIRGWPVE